MAYFDDRTLAENAMGGDFYVCRLFGAIKKANRESKTLFRKPQSEQLGKVSIGVCAEHPVELFFV